MIIKESHFIFVLDNVLRKNLDIAFDYTVELVIISNSYLKKEIRSSFRKTIIIYTASIIEALLVLSFKKKIKTEKVTLEDWQYKDIRLIHKISENPAEEIIWGRRSREIKKLKNLDFCRISRLCLKHKIVTKKIFSDLEKVRKLRNRLHIGGLETIEKDYRKRDIEFVFGVAKNVKIITADICKK